MGGSLTYGKEILEDKEEIRMPTPPN